MTTSAELVAQLQDIGLSGYEAKAYLALIASEGPLNGYEVAKRSGVPRSTVYETLSKLSARGAAFEVHDSETTAYVALPPDALLRRVRARVEQSLEVLATHLDAVTQPREVPVSHHIEGREAVLQRAVDLVGSAKRELYVSGWADDLHELEPALRAAQQLGVDVMIVRFDGAGPLPGHVTEHRFPDPTALLEQGGCRLLVVVEDRRQVLIAGSVDEQMWAVSSDDPALITLATEGLRSDRAVQALVAEVGADAAADIVDPHERAGRLGRSRSVPAVGRTTRR
ncbi:MAG: transcriptional regulator, TrmB [Acidimicrobiales bacterium]|nr:transcriptional regulator, TrmB [Acidimicrobiales bacterium]